ncbi:4394_t:CDS:2 [Paraglomus brasilianum]|uniref:Chorismate mutase n=1 Tax=Paraglomus brasilianum TaxID=144538 RepID=A0A9N9D8H1_9GLOM|nr:4394_t:CDS:2 [Paraglomus brasilianum]
MNFVTGNPREAISLDKLRNVLIRLEDTIIFALIERSQFAHNDIIYKPGAYKYRGSDELSTSFLEYFLWEIEKVHAKARRYQSPDEYPFTGPLPDPVIPPLEYPRILKPNNINVNSKIMEFYINHIVPSLCVSDDDMNHGSAATRDIDCLQALSHRIHYGKYVAEAKFQDPDLQPKYIQLIKAKNRKAIEDLLTNEKVEEALLRRLRRKALTYGQDITESDSIIEDKNPIHKHLKIDVDVVVELYEKWVIPLTKEVEVEYLLQRLD